MDVTPEEVDRKLGVIKAHMPEVYQAIQERARADGKQVFAAVRNGLRGRPDCFYAVEAGRVVGTPFTAAVQAEVAQLIVRWGMSSLCMLPTFEVGGEHGAY